MKIYIKGETEKENVSINEYRTVVFENETAKFRIMFDDDKVYVNKIATNHAKDIDKITIMPLFGNGVVLK